MERPHTTRPRLWEARALVAILCFAQICAASRCKRRVATAPRHEGATGIALTLEHDVNVGFERLVISGWRNSGDAAFESFELHEMAVLQGSGSVTVEIVAGPELDGVEVWVEVDGLVGDLVAVSGTAIAVLSAGQLVPAYALLGRPCQCGDGRVCALRETCDDGNTADGDGCSSDCTVEPGHVCTNTLDRPSFCVAGVPAACANGVDDDGDGLTDYPDDPGCTDTSDRSEIGGAEPCDGDGDDDAVCDDDNDGFSDADEQTCGSDPQNALSVPADTDFDGLCDAGVDDDDDNDGVSDLVEGAQGTNPVDEMRCGDTDGDGCDDCAVTGDLLDDGPDADPWNDGPDDDSDGICNAEEGPQVLFGPPTLAFGDGTSSAGVFEYGGMLYLGPRADGTGAVRAAADGSGAQSVAFSFLRDDAGNRARNSCSAAPACSPPYPALGTPGCVENSAECGPDNEDGLGAMWSGWVAGSEWLVAAGDRSGGDWDYLYMTNDAGTAHTLAYVDVSAVSGPESRGVSAAAFFENRLYAGLVDTGRQRPGLFSLAAVPRELASGITGLDASDRGDVLDLEGDKLPRIGSEGRPRNPSSDRPLIIDWIGEVNDRLYVCNNGGCVRSDVVGHPGKGDSSDWVDCTPSSVDFWAKTSVTGAKVVDLAPADKAFPSLAEYRGRLYAGRNTESGPQLWMCDPTGGDSVTDCDPDDWSLVAPNTVGDPQLTQFNNPRNTAMTLVAASDNRLWVGFDNATDGAVMFQSSVPAPTSRADFRGANGCSAAGHPGGCESVGGKSVGAGASTMLLSAKALTFHGVTYLYVVAGDGVSEVYVVRFAGP